MHFFSGPLALPVSARAALVVGALALATPIATFAAAAIPAASEGEASADGAIAQADVSAAEDAAIDLVQDYYNAVEDFVATFEQEYASAALGETMRSNGRVYFRKPGMMRWDYAAPTERYFISNGHDLWVYEPEFGQYFTDTLGDSQLPAALRFLMGDGSLRDEFHVSLLDQDDDTVTLSLVPKTPSSQYARLRFVADAGTGQVRTTVIYDALGNTNTLTFSGIVTNQNLPEAPFTFTPPEGAVRVDTPN